MGLRDTLLRKALSCALSYAFASLHYCYVDRRVHAARDRIYTPRFGKLIAFLGYLTTTVGIVGGASCQSVEALTAYAA